MIKYTFTYGSDNLITTINDGSDTLTLQTPLKYTQVVQTLNEGKGFIDIEGNIFFFKSSGGSGLELEDGKIIFKGNTIKHFNLKSTFSLPITFNQRVENAKDRTGKAFKVGEIFTFNNTLTYFFRTNTTSQTNMNVSDLDSLDIFYFLINTDEYGDAVGRNIGITIKVENFVCTKLWSRELPNDWNPGTAEKNNESLLPSVENTLDGEVVSADWKILFTKSTEKVTLTNTTTTDIIEDV